MTENTNNELVVATATGELINPEQVMTVTQELQQGAQDTFSSFDLSKADVVTRAMVSTAIATPEKRIADVVNMTINIKDVIIHKVEMVDEQTGELVSVPRIILVDTEGTSFVAVSKGVYNVLRTNIFPLFSFPTWSEGLPLLVQRGGTGTRKFLTLVPDVKELQKRNKK